MLEYCSVELLKESSSLISTRFNWVHVWLSRQTGVHVRLEMFWGWRAVLQLWLVGNLLVRARSFFSQMPIHHSHTQHSLQSAPYSHTHAYPLKSDGACPVHCGIACLEHFICFSPWSLLKSAVKSSICRPLKPFLHSIERSDLSCEVTLWAPSRHVLNFYGFGVARFDVR